MADYNLGTARGMIEIGYNGKGVDQATEGLKQTEKQTGSTDAAFKKVSTGALVAGAAIAGGLAVAVNSAADFEKRMSAVGAVSGATASEMDALQEKALQLGKDTQYSATESASAIEELVKAGLSVSDVLNGAADATVSLAAAGEVDLPQAAAIASNAMNQFGLAAENMPKVADAIAGAANASAIDVSDFGQSLSQVGAVANLSGVSFEDTATAIALMGNAGIKGSDAGTSLKTMFQRLQPTTKATVEEFDRLGLSFFDNEKAIKALKDNGITPLGTDSGTLNKQLNELAASLAGVEPGSAKAANAQFKLMTQTGALGNAFYDEQGNLKSFSEVAGLLKGSLEGMTAEQKQATLQTLFGSDAIRAAAIISNEGAEGFDAMAESMGKVSAEEVAEKRMDNLAGSIEKMKGSIETAGISIGDALIPAIRFIADSISALVDVFLALPKGVATGIAIFAAAAAAILLIAGAVMKAIIMFAELQKALVVLRASMAATWLAALGPIALIIAAIVAVVAILVILWKKSDTFRNIVIGAWNAIKAAVAAVANWFTGTLVPLVIGVWNAIVNAIKAAVSFVAAIIRTYIAIWRTIITTALNAILAVWRFVWGIFGPIVKAAFGLIVAIVKLYWTIIKGLFLLALNGLKLVVTTVFKAISAVVRTYMNAVKAIIAAVWKVIGPAVKTAVNTIKSTITGAWNAIKTTTSTIWNGLKAVVRTAIDGVVGVVKGLKDKVLSPLANAGTWLYEKGKAIIQGLINGITAMIDKVKGAITSVTSKIADLLPGSPVAEGPLMVLNKGYAGKQIVKMIVEGIDDDGSDIVKTLAANLTVPPATGPGTALTAVSSPPSPGSVASTPQGALRIVSGTLALDERGRAFITGLAQDVVNVNAAATAVAGRQRRIA